MARDRRDAAVERERRERERRERARRRSAAVREARAARREAATGRVRSAPATDRERVPARVDVAVATATRDRHEGLVGWIVRNVVEAPATIASLPRLVVAMLRGFALEVGAVVGGIGRTLLSVVPGSRHVAGVGRAAAERTGALGRPVQRTRGVSVRRSAQLKRRLRIAGAVVVVAAIVVAWVVVPASDVFRIRHLEVTGASAVGDLEVRERIDSLLEGRTVFTVDEDALAASIEELPFVREVRVERHLPGGLQLHVLEYRPLALGLSGGGGTGDGGTGDRGAGDDDAGARFWLVARDGRVLAPARHDEWSGRIPTVTLLDRDVEPGDHVDDEPALRLLASRPASSTLAFESITADEYAITARLAEGVEVRFGRPFAMRQKLLVAETMVQYAARKDLELLYVDVTVPGKPSFCARSVVACGMRRGPKDTGSQARGTTSDPGARAGADAASEDLTARGTVTSGADQLASEDA